jgi:hypothetical protein
MGLGRSLTFFVTPRADFVLSPTKLFLNDEQTGSAGVMRLTCNLEVAFNTKRKTRDSP